MIGHGVDFGVAEFLASVKDAHLYDLRELLGVCIMVERNVTLDSISPSMSAYEPCASLR